MEQNHFIPHTTIAWLNHWEVDPTNIETLTKIWSELSTVEARLIANGRAPGRCALSATRIGFGGDFDVLVFEEGILTINEMTERGMPRFTYHIEENEITIHEHHASIAVKKVWTRYRAHLGHYTWQCTYSEKPTAPKHIRHGLPMSGVQLAAELSHVLEDRQKLQQPADQTLSRTLACLIESVHWKRRLTEQEVNDIHANWREISKVFISLETPTEEEISTALTVLQHAAVTRSDATHRMTALYARIVESQKPENRDRLFNAPPLPRLDGIRDT